MHRDHFLKNHFETLSYKEFFPRAAETYGRKIVTSSGVVLFDRVWTLYSTYHSPYVIARMLGLTVGSLGIRSLKEMPQDNTYGIIHSVWTAGYYHWITESLPRALAIYEQFPETVPLLPRSHKKFAESLHLLGFSRVAYFPERSNVIVESPILTDCPPRFGTTSPAILRKVYKKVTESLGLREQRPTQFIYVSRNKARGRRIANEEQLSLALSTLGVKSVCFEDFSFSEQVTLMSSVKCIISIHGAALTNMIFMKPGGVVMELLPRKHGIFDYNWVRNSVRHDSCYVRLSQAMGHDYRVVFGDALVPWHRGTHMADLSIDVSKVAAAVREVISD